MQVARVVPSRCELLEEPGSVFAVLAVGSTHLHVAGRSREPGSDSSGVGRRRVIYALASHRSERRSPIADVVVGVRSVASHASREGLDRCEDQAANSAGSSL